MTDTIEKAALPAPQPGDRVQCVGTVRRAVDRDGWVTVLIDGEGASTPIAADALLPLPTAPAHLRAAAEWQPVATAPSADDGDVWIWAFGGVHTEPAVVLADGAYWRDEPHPDAPTMWMPCDVPAPPLESTSAPKPPPTLRELAEKAAEQFEFYEQQHRAKGTPLANVKADVNQALAAEIREALAREVQS